MIDITPYDATKEINITPSKITNSIDLVQENKIWQQQTNK